MQQLSANLDENITQAKKLLPIGLSFDLITRELELGKTRAYWIGINGFCRTELLQRLFSDLQNPLYMKDQTVENIEEYMKAKIGYSQVSLENRWDVLLQNLLSGPSFLLIDGFDQAIIIDVRTYPTRGIEEPEAEKVTRGSRDGFVETLLFNTNLIRRRLRSPALTFEIQTAGSVSKTDIAIAYMKDEVNEKLLARLKKSLQELSATTLTMGAKSLEELLIRKRWFNPLPSLHMTERPDVACSFLTEGHILVIVDNSPTVLILPCNLFQFTQSPEDYYKPPIVGCYFRMIRFFCILVSLFLMPVFLLITVYYPQQAAQWQLMTTEGIGPIKLIFYVIAVEFFLDLFKNAAALNSNLFSGSLSIVGGLIIGDVAVQLNWVSIEILFYAAITLLTSISLSSMEFGDGLRIYRFFLIAATSVGGIWGFGIGILLILISTATTPTFGGMSYLWPLYPFHWKALKTLLFRYPAAKAQPSSIWNRTNG